ncbi:hypothetical protein [Streptomyces sp. NPDC089919]|uniref:hypothetical protein n=1 Tax=Streptomyces sp. NPDC089919 TaxID=3155188 RepID=UPI003443BF83
MTRRLVAAAAAIVLFLEAVGLVIVHVVLGTAVDRQSMSVAGMDPDVMSGATYAMGAVMGAFLAFCGLLAARTAVTDRAPGRVGRLVLIGCAITHGVLGALVVGMVGWGAFTFMMAVLALVVLTLVAYAREVEAKAYEEPPGRELPPPAAV